MDEQDRKNTVSNIVSTMKGIVSERKDEIINRQLCHFFRADRQLGVVVDLKKVQKCSGLLKVYFISELHFVNNYIALILNTILNK